VGTFDQGHDAVPRLVVALHRVDLPVADDLARLHIRRALRDVALAGEASARVVGAVALAPPLARLAQVPPELAAGALLAPDVHVDGLVADAQEALRPQEPRHLLRAPVEAQVALDQLPGLRCDALVAA
jgi:hypothetical protein